MTLRDLIARLEALPQDMVFAKGFHSPHSWRGVYAELSFVPVANTRVSAMLHDAKSAVGDTYQGWKGGYFSMSLDTDVHLDEEGECSDDGDRIMGLFGQVPLQPAPGNADPNMNQHLPQRRKRASKILPGCSHIDDKDRLCHKKSVDRWRVMAQAPQDPSVRAFMLVPLCKSHGEKASKQRRRKK